MNERINKLARQLNCPDVADDLQSRLQHLQSKLVCLTVTGEANSGKTCMVNALTGSMLDEGPVPTNRPARVVYAALSPQADDVPTTVVDNEWMKAHDLMVCELPGHTLPEPPQLIDLGLHFAQTDICLFMVNALSALNRWETEQLAALNQLGIPTLVVLSRSDLLQPADYDNLLAYVRKGIASWKHVQLVATEHPAPTAQAAPLVRDAIDRLLATADPRQSARQGLADLFTVDTLTRLYAACTARLDAIGQQRQRIEKQTSDKLARLSDQSTTWLRIQRDMQARKQAAATRINQVLSERKEDIVRQIAHAVSMCNDIKLYWEKQMPFDLENSMRAQAQYITQTINSDVVATINWLNMEVKRAFNQNLNVLNPVACHVNVQTVHTGDVKLADNRKLRIMARVGTATTAIVAGTLLVSSGVGGVVMAVSMLAGLGSEFLMSHKQDESKKRVQALIPQIVEQAQSKVALSTADNLGEVYAQLLRDVQAYQKSLTDAARNEIEKEKSIALFNCDTDAASLNQCMQEIDELSTRFLPADNGTQPD